MLRRQNEAIHKLENAEDEEQKKEEAKDKYFSYFWHGLLIFGTGNQLENMNSSDVNNVNTALQVNFALPKPCNHP